MSKLPPDEQASSDALPYTQVHRAVKPKAALLAGKLGVTPQHALGSLVEFWDLCAGDQRDLERILDATPPGAEPAIVLSAADVAGRFELASGHTVEPVTLERLGLLEARPDGFRVRGMSRYFAPITRKVVLRERASRGGLASAASRAAAQAGAQPPAQAGAQAGASTCGNTAEAVSSEQLAERSDQKQIVVGPAPKKPKGKPKAQAELTEIIPPPPPREPSRGEVLFQKFRETREDHLKDVLEVEAYADATYATTFVNKLFRGWLDLWAAVPFNEKWLEVGITTGAEARCIQLFDAYLELDWPAKCVARVDGKDTDTPQPYPFSSLASEKVWGDLVAKLWPDEPYALAWPERREQLYADKPRRGAA